MGVVALLCAVCACEGPGRVREAVVVSVLARAEEPLLRSRPDLVAGKLVRMANEPYAFYRGTVPLFREDVLNPSREIAQTRFPVAAAPLSLGDAHVENFGTLRAPDGTFGLEPNDLDGADRYPYHWDLRRLTVGMVVAARLSHPDDPTARAALVAVESELAGAVARGYAEAIVAHRDGRPRARVEADAVRSAFVADLFRRSEGDADDFEELDEITVLEGEVRRFPRGAFEADDPEHLFQTLPPAVLDALPQTLRRYRETLANPPPPEALTVVDAVRELGTGVASWARVRILVLVRGESDAPDDDIILEIKELADSGVPVTFPPNVPADTLEGRTRWAAAHVWARSDADPWFGTSSLLGMPMQVRRETEEHKTLRIRRIRDEEGTLESVRELAALLGALLARVHATPAGDDGAAGRAIADVLVRDIDGFVAQEAGVAVRYADQVERDRAHLQRALARLGPRLGIPLDDQRPPSPERRLVYGQPAPPPPLREAP